MPPLFLRKADFETFQNVEFPSGVVATPKSPIPPALASGLIRKKGTAVVTTLMVGCAEATTAAKSETPKKALRKVDLMNLLFKKNEGFALLTSGRCGPAKPVLNR
jgi:hypothetical protein